MSASVAPLRYLSMLLSSPLLFLLFLLFLLSSPSFATITSEDGSMVFQSTDFPGTKLPVPSKCGKLVLLPFTSGCQLPPDFALDTKSIFVVDYETIEPLGCKYYSDALLALLPYAEPSILNGSFVMVALWSPYYSSVGTYSDPYGNLTVGVMVSPNISSAVITRPGGSQMMGFPNETFCFHPDPGVWLQFYATSAIGWIWFWFCVNIIFLFGSVYLIVKSFQDGQKRVSIRILALTSASLCFLFRCLELSIDEGNHLGRLSLAAWAFLYNTRFLFVTLCICLMLYSWSQLVHQDLTSSSFSCIIKVNYFLIGTVSISCLLYAIFVEVSYLTPVVPTLIGTSFLLFCAISFVFMIIFFIILGIHILSMTKSLMKSSTSLLVKKRVTVIMICCAGSLLGSLIVTFTRLYEVIGDQEVPFPADLASVFLISLFTFTVCGGVVLAYALHTFEKDTEHSSHTSQSEKEKEKEKHKSNLSAENIILELQQPQPSLSV